jgi:cell division protein FtsL
MPLPAHGLREETPHRSRWPLFFVASVAVFFFIGVSTVRETYRALQVDDEIKGLETQVNAMEGKKTKLMQAIQELNSPDGLDRAARGQLDMRKPGERVIVVRGIGEKSALNQLEPVPPSLSLSQAELPQTTPKRWFYYFFHFSL